MNGKKIAAILAALSLGICTGCTGQEQETEGQEMGKTDAVVENVHPEEAETEEILQQEYVLYQKYKRALQRIDECCEAYAIFEKDGWESAKDCYRAVLSETEFGMFEHSCHDYDYTVNQMRGILAVETVEKCDEYGSRYGLGVRIAVSEADEVWEYGYYDDVSYGDEYIICRKTGAKDGDVPEYQLCEEVLCQERLNHWTDDSSNEEEWEEWLDEYGQMAGGEITEYFAADNHVYRIDREKKQFHDVTGQTESYMVQWLRLEKEKACHGMKVTDEAVEKVKGFMPDGYCLKWEKDIAACDLNHDREDDYVAGIYPRHNASDADLWLFLSNGSGEYTKKQLGSLKCYQLQFVGDGVLMCENGAGIYNNRSPTRIEYFLYDDAAENFYLEKVCQNEKYDGVLIEDRTSLERLRIGDYWGRQDEIISRGYDSLDYYAYPEDGRKVQFWSCVIYKNADKEIEKTVNDKVFGMNLAAAENLLRAFDEDIMIKSCLKYLNPHIYGGYIEGVVWKKEGSVDYFVPVMIDLENGEFLDITNLLSKEELIGICQKGMKDEYRNELSAEEMERGISLIEDKYEDAFRVTSSGELILTSEESWVYLEITSWGVQVTGEDNAGEISFWLDKEYFIDTPLWHYMEPVF